MNKILLVSLLSFASMQALSLDTLGDYWQAKTDKRDRSKASTRIATTSGLNSTYEEAEDNYSRRDFINAHKNYSLLYKKIVKEKILHDFNNKQLANIYEGLALCSHVVSKRKRARAYKVGLGALKKALELDLPQNKIVSLRFSLEVIKTKQKQLKQ